MPPQPGVLRSRWTAYAGLSTLLAGGVIFKSLLQRPNFYSAAVYLSQSSANLMILCNLVLVTACSILLLLQKLLYGPLRPIEIEQLYEKAWFAVTETCLAMTIFRGELGAWFLVMFFSLLAGKVWGWIGEGRVEIMEQQQHNLQHGRSAGLFHTRLALSLALGVIFDMTMLEYVVDQVLHMARPDMLVMFGFEFAVLTIMSLSTATRYSLNLIEIGIVRGQKQKRVDAIRKERADTAVREFQARQRQQAEVSGENQQPTPAVPDAADSEERTRIAAAAAARPVDEAEIEVEGWESKGRWLFYLDLATDFFKLVVYISFFFILLIFYGLPLHIMRDVFLTCRSFFKRIGDFMRYRTATRDMNARYPDATAADFGREDVCIICREEMRPYVPPAQGQPTDPVAERMRPKKLPCGHVLHFSCLRSWLERQQICPTCRATVVRTPQATQTPAQGGAAGGQNARNRGNARPRVYQIGPLRIGVGAARGNNMLEELEQELANPNPLPPPGQNANGPRQFGFGIRWDGIRRRGGAQHRLTRGSGQDILEAAERQIQRELDSLQASLGELQALNNVQAQLARIRMARQNAQQQSSTSGTNQTSAQSRSATSTSTGLSSNQQQNLLQAGSDQLPQGLTLPEGWTMMPLQPMQQLPQLPLPQIQIPSFAQVPPLGQMPMGGMVMQGIIPQQEQSSQSPQPPQPPQAAQVDPVRSISPMLQSLVEERNRLATQRGRLEEQNAELADRRARLEAINARLRESNLSSDVRNVLSTFANHDESERSRSTSTTQRTNDMTDDRPASAQPQRPQMAANVIDARNSQPSQSNNTSQTSQVPTSIRSSRASPASHRVQNSTTAPRVLPSRVAPPPSASSSDSSDGDSGRRIPSSHRPTRSIGSSWGFPSNEADSERRNRDRQQNTDTGRTELDHDDDEDDEEDEDGIYEHNSKNINRTSQPVGARSNIQSITNVRKGRPTVEDDDDESDNSS